MHVYRWGLGWFAMMTIDCQAIRPKTGVVPAGSSHSKSIYVNLIHHWAGNRIIFHLSTSVLDYWRRSSSIITSLMGRYIARQKDAGDGRTGFKGMKSGLNWIFSQIRSFNQVMSLAGRAATTGVNTHAVRGDKSFIYLGVDWGKNIQPNHAGILQRPSRNVMFEFESNQVFRSFWQLYDFETFSKRAFPSSVLSYTHSFHRWMWKVSVYKHHSLAQIAGMVACPSVHSEMLVWMLFINKHW